MKSEVRRCLTVPGSGGAGGLEDDGEGPWGVGAEQMLADIGMRNTGAWGYEGACRATNGWYFGVCRGM